MSPQQLETGSRSSGAAPVPSGEQAAAELAALVAASPDALISVDRQGAIRSWNPAAEKLFGYTAEEILGRDLTILMPEELRDEGMDILARMRRGERVEEYETVRLAKSGRRIPVRISLAPILSAEGSLKGVCGIVHDLSARKSAQRSARLRAARYRSLVEGAPVAIWEEDLWELKKALERLEARHGDALEKHLDSDPAVLDELLGTVRILDVNPATLRMHKAESKNELLDSLQRIFLPETLPTFRANCLALLKGETRFATQTVHGTLDGERLEVRLHINVPGDPPDYGRAVVIVDDIGAVRRAEAELARRAGDLQRSNAELEQFAYSASHDLQEPLAIVARFAELIAIRGGGPRDERVEGWLGHIVSETRRMQAMIDSLLELSRTSTRPPRFEPVDLNDALAEALRVLRAEIKAAGAEISREKLCTVRGDRLHLVRLLRNLVGNALKFRGEPAPRIHIGGSREGEMCHCWVRDNGIGIDPRYAAQVFQPFKRLNLLEEFPGTGVGLAIARRVVELHEGKIWVESEEGAGATFHFTLRRIAETKR